MWEGVCCRKCGKVRKHTGDNFHTLLCRESLIFCYELSWRTIRTAIQAFKLLFGGDFGGKEAIHGLHSEGISLACILDSNTSFPTRSPDYPLVIVLEFSFSRGASFLTKETKEDATEVSETHRPATPMSERKLFSRAFGGSPIAGYG